MFTFNELSEAALGGCTACSVLKDCVIAFESPEDIKHLKVEAKGLYGKAQLFETVILRGRLEWLEFYVPYGKHMHLERWACST